MSEFATALNEEYADVQRHRLAVEKIQREIVEQSQAANAAADEYRALMRVMNERDVVAHERMATALESIAKSLALEDVNGG